MIGFIHILVLSYNKTGHILKSQILWFFFYRRAEYFRNSRVNSESVEENTWIVSLHRRNSMINDI